MPLLPILPTNFLFITTLLSTGYTKIGVFLHYANCQKPERKYEALSYKTTFYGQMGEKHVLREFDSFS